MKELAEKIYKAQFDWLDTMMEHVHVKRGELSEIKEKMIQEIQSVIDEYFKDRAILDHDNKSCYVCGKEISKVIEESMTPEMLDSSKGPQPHQSLQDRARDQIEFHITATSDESDLMIVAHPVEIEPGLWTTFISRESAAHFAAKFAQSEIESELNEFFSWLWSINMIKNLYINPDDLVKKYIEAKSKLKDHE